MGLVNKFRALQAARRLHLPDPGEESGDAGEVEVLDAVRSFVGGRRSECRCYRSLRVPRTDEKGKYEIDLLAATPFGLLGLEVKNWGGRVDLNADGTWRRVNSQGATQPPIDDPVRLMEAKMSAVAAYLTANGAAVPSHALTRAVVLNNPRLQIGPQLAPRPHLLRRPDLPPLLKARLFPNRPGLWPFLRRLLGLEKTNPPLLSNFAEVLKVLDRLPTWDAVALHGGRVLKGDIAGPGVRLASGNHLTRRDTREVRLHIPRSWFLGWFATASASWIDSAGVRRRERVAPGQTLVVRLAGRKEEHQAALEGVENITFGWEDESYYRAPKPDLESYRPGAAYQGTVTGVQDYGLFVDLDGRRDGLVPVSLLNRRGRSPAEYRRGQAIRVRVVRTKVQKGKEMIDLDLDET